MSDVRLYLLGFLALSLLVACSPSSSLTSISISIQVDGESRQVSVPSGSSVRQVLEGAGIELGQLDRTEPSFLTELAEGETVRIIRVVEEFETEEVVTPFISRTLRNESLPAGQQQLIQNGENGLEEITHRLLYEDGELVSRTEFERRTVTAPVEEIIMIGAPSLFSSVDIQGRLAFISSGNAWVLETNSGVRRPIVTTGDLDGRVFELSPNGEWLLFTRQSSEEGPINELWAASLEEANQLIDLRVENVVHYAGWVPGGSDTQIAFSSVEPSLNPPGWQADNDLQFMNFTAEGDLSNRRIGIPANEDSLYSWWGSTFAWSADGLLAFSRPDAVGLADIDRDNFNILLPLLPYQTGSDWAWMPSLSWSPNGEVIFTVEHVEQQGLEIQERSPVFDLVSVSASGQKTTVAQNVGMFASPVVESLGDQVAYLRALIPSQSDISGYELMVAAPSGVSISLFPPEGIAGLQPQRVAWSPSAETGPLIAFIYQGNLWLVNVLSGEASQVTGDGLVTAVSWR